MLSSSWPVTLRLAVSEIFAVKCGQNLAPKFGIFGIPWGIAPKRRDRSGTKMYHHATFHADRCRRHICNRTKTYSSFCRAMLCKRGLCRHAVSVCMCLSVTFEHTVKTNKHIFKIFSPSGSHTILAFFIPNIMAIFRRGPP